MTKVKSIEHLEQTSETYDFTVPINHNYIINSGGEDILVHNCKHFIVRDVLGPVTAKSKSTAMIPIIKLWETGIKPKTHHKTWHGMLSFIQKDEKHKNEIVKQAFRDLRAGHQCILVPLDRKQHVFDIVDRINKQASVNNAKRNENWQIPLAKAFHAGTPRNEFLQEVDNREIRVVVPIRSMMKMGIDMSEPSMLYNVVPTSNPPMYYQLINRVCTPLAGKQPVIRHMIDMTPQSYYCFKSIFKKEILPGLKGKRDGQQLYQMNKRDYSRAIEILKLPLNYYRPNVPVNNELVASDAEAGTTRTNQAAIDNKEKNKKTEDIKDTKDTKKKKSTKKNTKLSAKQRIENRKRKRSKRRYNKKKNKTDIRVRKW